MVDYEALCCKGRQVGKGTYSRVFQVINGEVIKRIKTQDMDEEDFYIREISCLYLLQGKEGIIKLLEAHVYEKFIYLVFPYYSKELYNLLNQGLPIPSRYILEKLLKAVKYMHGKNVLHRDIKPGNIMMTDGGDPIICDFGMSIKTDDDNITYDPNEELMCTLPYRSIGLLLQTETYLYEVDIWALGIITLEMLQRGFFPFQPEEKNYIQRTFNWLKKPVEWQDFTVKIDEYKEPDTPGLKALVTDDSLWPLIKHMICWPTKYKNAEELLKMLK